MLEAARRRSQPSDHLLFAGPPGLGKTSLAGIVANEMGAGLRITSGPALVRAGDLAAILTNLAEGDVLFVDEIHRLGRAVEEILYPAMEDFQLDIVLGKGPSARTVRLDLPPFTLVGATTRTGLITGPLRDRFGFVARLDYYSPGDLDAIIRRSGAILDVHLDTSGAAEIARRARGTPRIANRLLKRVRDFAEVRGDGSVDEGVARRGPRAVRRRRARTRQGGPGHPGRHLLAVRGRPGRPVNPGRQHRGGDRHRRGRLRAVPAASRAAHADTPGPGGDPRGVAAPRPRPAGAGPRTGLADPASLWPGPRPGFWPAGAIVSRRGGARVPLARGRHRPATPRAPRRRPAPGRHSTRAARSPTGWSATCPCSWAPATCWSLTPPGSCPPGCAWSSRPVGPPKCCCSSRIRDPGSRSWQALVRPGRRLAAGHRAGDDARRRRGGGGRRAPIGGPAAGPAAGRAGGPARPVRDRGPAALYPRAAGRSRALPDGLRRTARLGRRPDRRSPPDR